MQDHLTSLEKKQAEHQSKVTPEDYEAWLSSNPTKALRLQLAIDLEDLRNNWSNGLFESGDKEIKARGQAEYITGLIEAFTGDQT